MIFQFAYKRYSLPFRGAVRTAQGPWSVREGVYVSLKNERGRVGYGEAAPIAWFGSETVDAIEQVCREIGVHVTEERLRAAVEGLSCLHFAMECAFTMLAERDAEETDAVAPKKTYLPVAALLPAGRVALGQIEAKAEMGFRTFKWKVGVGDPADELAMLDDLIGHLPSGGKLRLDANGAWDRRITERWLARCADRPVEFLEQPIATTTRGVEDILLGLANDYPTPLALDESVVGGGDVERWLGAGWPGFFVIKLLLLAKPVETLARLEKAKAKVVFSSALETALGARAALTMALAYPGQPHALGFGVWPLFSDERFDGPQSAPFIRSEDVERIQPEALWNALT